MIIIYEILYRKNIIIIIAHLQALTTPRTPRISTYVWRERDKW